MLLRYRLSGKAGKLAVPLSCREELQWEGLRVAKYPGWLSCLAHSLCVGLESPVSYRFAGFLRRVTVSQSPWEGLPSHRVAGKGYRFAVSGKGCCTVVFLGEVAVLWSFWEALASQSLWVLCRRVSTKSYHAVVSLERVVVPQKPKSLGRVVVPQKPKSLERVVVPQKPKSLGRVVVLRILKKGLPCC